MKKLMFCILMISLFSLSATGVLFAQSQAKGNVKQTKVSLRSQTGTFSKGDIVRMIREKGFHHPYDQSSWQLSPTVKGNVQHEYVQKTEAGKKVVLDHATGLMWQQSGSSQTKSWAEAHDYVQEMNKGNYAGFSDWRLPTIEELASLLESVKKNGDLYIDQVFDPTQQWCWSGDKMKEDAARAWRVHFQLGGVDGYRIKRNITYVRAVRTL
jgi:Protein of unknown function (DUF1566)